MKQDIIRMAEAAGAKAGIAPADRLVSLPSADPNFLLPGAKSVIALLMPLDEDIVRRYLAGHDQLNYSKHDEEINARIFVLATQIADYLQGQGQGHRALAVPTNQNYRYLVTSRRHDIPPRLLRMIMNWVTAPSGKINQALKRQFAKRYIIPQIRNQNWDLTPTFSHRYAAVAAGLGGIGWSGNLVSAHFGSRVVLDSIITDAELIPDPMLDYYPCDRCLTCAAVCQSGYINTKESQQTIINGVKFIHNRHGHNIRCTVVCGGISGQSRYPEWTTWSPGRIRLPDSDEEMKRWFEDFINHNMWRGNMYSQAMRDLFLMSRGLNVDGSMSTCTFCRAVCWKTRAERQENYRLIKAAGDRSNLKPQ